MCCSKYLLFILALIFVSPSCKKERLYEGRVYVQKDENGYTLMRNGKPFFIKGAAGASHFADLARAGGNTIRTWDTVNIKKILDSAHYHNLAVMVGFPVIKSIHKSFYSDKLKVESQHQAIKQVINTYKDHPAVLMWVLGNELGFGTDPAYGQFYNAFNDLVAMAHKVDPDHPVTTTLINFPEKDLINIKFKIPNLDIVAFNIFGQITSINNGWKYFSWLWDVPFIITEWGCNGPWESETTAWGAPIEDTSTKKAERYQEIYSNYIPFDNKNLIGTTVFYWGYKVERTHTWFSLFTENGAYSESVKTLENLWKGKPNKMYGPPIDQMLVEKKTARDNLLFNPGEYRKAEILFTRPVNDSIVIHWEILPEVWYDTTQGNIPEKKFLQEQLIEQNNNPEVVFKTPSAEGPYRLFVYAYDDQNIFATANTPFYVIK